MRARNAVLTVAFLALAGCQIVSNRLASPNNPDPVPTPTPSATPTPSPNPTPSAAGLVRPTSVRVAPFGITCPAGVPAPSNGAGVLPVGCEADVTATPKRADGTDLTDAEHGPAIDWRLVAVDASVVDVAVFPGVAFNRSVTGRKVGRFRLCATVQGVEGCWGSEAAPVEVIS